MKTNRKLFPLVACLVLAVLMAIVPMFGVAAAADTTIKFVVPDGLTAPASQSASTALPQGPALSGHTFVGWAEEKVAETTAEPIYYKAGTVYKGSQAKLYALYTYTAAGGSAYNKIDLAKITSTDIIVITATSSSDGKTYALDYSKGTSAAPVAEIVTVSGNSISGITDTLKWNVSKDENGYIFYPNGTTDTWLYCTNANNGVRVGTNTNKYFVMDSSSGYFKNVATSRYLGVYTTNPDWRCYTSTTSNIKDQTFSFYKETVASSSTYYTTGNTDETFTVTFSTAVGLPTVNSVQVKESTGTTIALPTASGNSQYTFVGWTTEPLTENTLAQPEILGESYTAEDDVTLYAVYSYTSTTSKGVYKLVTDKNALSAGDKIVIVANEYDFALGTTQNSNNRSQSNIFKSENYILISSDTQIITLEEGNVDNSFAFNVGDGYLYAASSSSNHLRTQETIDNNSSWTITVADGVASVTAKGENTKNVLKYNNSNKLFSCYESGQKDVCIYKIDTSTSLTATFYTSSACAHSSTVEETTKAPTCSKTGVKTTSCANCGTVISTEELPIVNHNIVNGACSFCGMKEDLSGRYYIAVMRSNDTTYRYATTVLDGSKRFGIFSTTLTTLPESITAPSAAYTFELEKNDDGTYYMSIAGIVSDTKYVQVTDAVGVTMVTKAEASALNIGYNDGAYTVTDPETGRALGFNISADISGWYKSSATTAINLLPVADSAELDTIKITAASITIGSDLAMKYYITLPEGYSIDKVKACFYMNKDNVTVTQYTENGDEYVFTYTGIAPQCMGDNIRAEFLVSNNVIAVKDNYSVKQNAENLINNVGAGDSLKTLIADMLNYGAAAQEYKKYKTDALVNVGITGATNVTPTATDDERSATIPSTDYQFTAVGVRFDYDNKLYAKFNAASTDGLTVKINDAEMSYTQLSDGNYIVYSDGISALEFGDTFTFQLVLNGTVVHEVTYSVNSYAYSMADNETMSNLALALYRYGLSAKKYSEGN